MYVKLPQASLNFYGMYMLLGVYVMTDLGEFNKYYINTMSMMRRDSAD